MRVELSWMALVFLFRRPHRAPWPLPPCGDPRRRCWLWTTKRALTAKWPCWKLHLRLPASRIINNAFLLFMSNPACGILLEKPNGLRQSSCSLQSSSPKTWEIMKTWGLLGGLHLKCESSDSTLPLLFWAKGSRAQWQDEVWMPVRPCLDLGQVLYLSQPLSPQFCHGHGVTLQTTYWHIASTQPKLQKWHPGHLKPSFVALFFTLEKFLSSLPVQAPGIHISGSLHRAHVSFVPLHLAFIILP